MTSDLRRMLAEGLATAEREYREAQAALKTDSSDAARARYAAAERNCRRMEQLVKAAGLGEASPQRREANAHHLETPRKGEQSRRAERPKQDVPSRQLQDYALVAPKKLKS